MTSAVIVSTARTPIGKAYRGAFNDTPAQTLGGHAIAAALGRAGVAGGEVDDVEGDRRAGAIAEGDSSLLDGELADLPHFLDRIGVALHVGAVAGSDG